MKRFYLSISVIFTFLTANAQSKVDEVVSQNVLMDAVSKMDTNPGEAKAELEYLDKKFAPDDAVKYYLGLICYATGKNDDAEKYLVAATQLDSTNSWYQDALAGFYGSTGRRAESANIYLKLMQAYPGRYSNPYTFTILGDRYLGQYMDSLAIDSYGKALALSPDYIPAVIGRAEAYRMSGNVAAFFIDARTFAKSPEVQTVAKCDYISQILKHIDYRFYRLWGAQLDTLVNDCVKTNPTDSSALKLAGSWYYSTERKTRALEYFNRLFEEYPQDMDVHYLKLSLLFEDAPMQEVLDECETIIKLGGEKNPRTVSALRAAGDCWHALGNDRKAMQYYEKVLKLAPENLPTLNNYAYYLSLAGKKLGKAEKMSRITVEKEPDNPTYLDTFGWILHLRGKDQEAKPYFKKAMVYGGKEHIEILEHYSEVLKSLGENDLSQYYKTLAENRKAEDGKK